MNSASGFIAGAPFYLKTQLRAPLQSLQPAPHAAWSTSHAGGRVSAREISGLRKRLIAKITKNYFDRKKGKDVKPMLSAYEEFNEDLAG